VAVRHLGHPGVETVAGGYKALRAHLVAGLAQAAGRAPPAGAGRPDRHRQDGGPARLTGAAGLLALDLEGHARHRGSAFGAEDEPQPAQATFENAVAADVVLSPAGLIVVEDESRYVGRRTVPEPLWLAMRPRRSSGSRRRSRTRVRRVFEGYVLAPTERHGPAAARARLTGRPAAAAPPAGRAAQRRGPRRPRAAAADWHDPAAHAGWIAALLTDYYDRLYGRAFEASGRPVAFRGAAEDVAAFLRAAA
jgi:tRNA 2-selenouridine synthase